MARNHQARQKLVSVKLEITSFHHTRPSAPPVGLSSAHYNHLIFLARTALLPSSRHPNSSRTSLPSHFNSPKPLNVKNNNEYKPSKMRRKPRAHSLYSAPQSLVPAVMAAVEEVSEKSGKVHIKSFPSTQKRRKLPCRHIIPLNRPSRHTYSSSPPRRRLKMSSRIGYLHHRLRFRSLRRREVREVGTMRRGGLI